MRQSPEQGRGARSFGVAAVALPAQRWPAMNRPPAFVRALCVLLVLFGATALPLYGCVLVPRYAREHISDPAMDPTSDAIGTRELRKLHWAREGAAGGDGAPAGGGCACGT